MSGVPGKYCYTPRMKLTQYINNHAAAEKKRFEKRGETLRREKKRNIIETGKRKWKKEDKRKDALRIITVNHIMDRDKVQVTEASRHQRWLIEVVEIRKRPQRT